MYFICTGHCHCDVGFSPPTCELPGPGGSIDSGPATDPSSKLITSLSNTDTRQ